MLDNIKDKYKILLLILIIFSTLSILTLLKSMGSNSLIALKLHSDKAGVAYLYVNNDWANPVLFNVKKDEIIDYQIETSTNIIKNVRLDPVDRLEATLKIYSVQVFNKDKVLKNITLDEISNWLFQHTTNTKLEGNFIKIVGDSKTPINIHAQIPAYEKKGISELNFLDSKYFDKAILMAILLFIFIENIKNRKLIYFILIMFFGSVPLFQNVNQYFSSVTQIQSVVGRSLISQGISGYGNQIGIISIFIFSALLSIFFLKNKID